MSTLPAMTDCGLPGLHAIPYGVHMCHFYETREELAAALVPYFRAGLRANERCIWMTAEPLDAAAAEAELVKAGLDPQVLAREGALMIRDHTDWFGTVDLSKPEQVMALWLEEERRALADGYRGIRITGNTSFVRPEDWPAFMAYEELADREFASRRIVTLCSYRLAHCAATDLLDVVRHHHCALDRPDHGWQILTARPETRALQALQARSGATPKSRGNFKPT
jgi:hypothetical protein